MAQPIQETAEGLDEVLQIANMQGELRSYNSLYYECDVKFEIAKCKRYNFNTL